MQLCVTYAMQSSAVTWQGFVFKNGISQSVDQMSE
jgi:hypothetical protein